MTASPGHARADHVAAQATGVGIGFLAFMMTWLVGARLADRVWGPPSSAVVALAVSAAVGIVVALVAACRLTARQRSETW